MQDIEFYSRQKIKETSLKFKRYLFGEINWDARLIGITGARGVGKTTLLLQYLKEQYGHGSMALYITLDHFYFSKNRLFNVVESFYMNGGKQIFIDEVHNYPEWSVEIKNLYDIYPGLKIVFSGSSAISINNAKADLSRRVAMYHLHELSFREYLEISDIGKFDVCNLDNIISNHVEISASITKEIKPIQYFNSYLNGGVYPFFKEVKAKYHERLSNVVQVIIENDLTAVENLNFGTAVKLRKTLALISESVPFKPNISELSQKIGVSRDFFVKLLNLLVKAGLIIMVRQNGAPTGHLTKPEKIYLKNTDLLFTLSDQGLVNRGTIRETFFINQLIQAHRAEVPKAGAFIINDIFTFEIGVKNKSTKRIAGIKDAFIAMDDIEIGYQNRIPLWMFGFLY